MKNIYILGAGGLAKEVYFLIRQIGGYYIKGFVDIVAGASIKISGKEVPVLGEKDLPLIKGASLAIAIGNPAVIQKLATTLEADFDFPNLIHPNVVADFENIVLGRGNIINANCSLTTFITIGSFNIFNPGITIGHDVVIGNYNLLNPGVAISGFVKIGDTNLIGVKATVLENRTIGSNSIVGAASLVLKNVPDEVTVIGVPAAIKEKRHAP
ncbi:acetyltransferase [Chitinophaga sp. OAE865]|uniref:acetyltransferase n=1 Tax=Chitinophaga sp. OAE865 TaxID=2817898 RepID=UPI001AEA70F7